MGFLTDKISEVRGALRAHPLDDAALMSRVASLPPARGFVAALESRCPALIAEIKRSSPSAGSIAEVDAGERAPAYEAAGASVISVLTEERHFGGSLADLWATHRSTSRVPVLRKDFLIHPSQLIESRASGADAVLLISACLGREELEAMLATAADLGLGALLETHSEEDLAKALATGARVIGVNSRDLESLDVDEERALALLRLVPDDRIAVFESGVSSRVHVERAVAAGASAVLVGEALMRAADPAAKISELLGGRD